MFQPSPIITVDNVTATLEQGLQAMASGVTVFDFTEVTVVDSTAVATLLAWQRAAQKQGIFLDFQHFPDNLKSLVDLYGVASLLHPASEIEPRADLLHH